MVTDAGIQPFPDSGARKLDARTSFFYTATGITPAMCMRLTNVGSQYLQTSQRYPRAGSQMFPTPAASAESDESTLVRFSPTQPEGVAAGNWVQTDPERGWFAILRLYSPLQSFFDKSWRPGEFEQVG